MKVEVFKELEDMSKPDRQAAGRAVFNNDFPVNRVREIVGPVPVPLQWIPRGRDAKLEQQILNQIRECSSCDGKSHSLRGPTTDARETRRRSGMVARSINRHRVGSWRGRSLRNPFSINPPPNRT